MGQHGAHVGRSEETCENGERLGRYEHAAFSENELGTVVDRVITQCARMTNAHVVLANG